MLNLIAAASLATTKPNIIFILADDLGYGELGCYGQTKIKTPNIDRLAREGIRFTQFYSGSPVCAPSRCTLLTGLHTGHAYVRDNYEFGGFEPDSKEGQLPLPDGTFTVARLLKSQGYAAAAMGKWGLGGPDSSGHPLKQGFDHFFGVLCQRQAHNHYPDHLWQDFTLYPLDNPTFSAHQKLAKPPADPKAYDRYRGSEYTSDLVTREALSFVRTNRDRPFFLYLPYPVPHAALQVPEDSLADYESVFEETPYLGNQGYLPHRKPRAAYAAMVSRMDRHIGQVRATLEDLGIAKNTLIIFSSDNGPTFNGGTDSKFFQSAGPLRDLKTSVFEGGIRVPFVAWWPDRIKPGQVSKHVGAFWDFLPTVADLLRVPMLTTDGVSFLSTLTGRGRQKTHPYLYWEFHSGGGLQALRKGDWKAVRRQVKKNPQGPIMLFDLGNDIGESTDIAKKHPKVVAELDRLMQKARTRSVVEDWNFGARPSRP
ncbi:MAG: arylsulfatase [Fimbriimonadaceae bacterium]|nr:arylsulfatase [Fimbriimonadaceae bacterium]